MENFKIKVSPAGDISVAAPATVEGHVIGGGIDFSVTFVTECSYGEDWETGRSVGVSNFYNAKDAFIAALTGDQQKEYRWAMKTGGELSFMLTHDAHMTLGAALQAAIKDRAEKARVAVANLRPEPDWEARDAAEDEYYSREGTK